MRWILNSKIWLHSFFRQKILCTESEETIFLRHARAAFSRRYREVCGACRILEESAAVSAERLTALYMSAVLEEKEALWWRENSLFLAQPWFIWEYALRRALIAPPAESAPPCGEWHILRPEHARHEDCIYITLHRENFSAGEGILRLNCPVCDERTALLHPRGFKPTQGGYSRTIPERAAPISDRAVENAIFLLQEGYPVCVEEPALYAMILEHRFSPEHLYWVLATQQIGKLRLMYPRDPQLHQYILMAGGRWNGKYMEFSISNTDRLEEIMHLYGFRATKEAQRRIHAWREAMDNATIYRRRHWKDRPTNEPPADMFRMLLQRNITVPEELRDTR